MGKRALLFFSLFLLVVFSLIYLGLTAYQNSLAPVEIAAINPTGSVTLEASPPPTHLVLDRPFPLSLNARSGSAHLTAVQLELAYDQGKITLDNLQTTDYLPLVIKAPKLENGLLQATLGAPLDSGGRSGWGSILNLTLTPRALGSHTLSFTPNNLATTLESNTNSLSSASDIIVTVFNLGDLNHDKIINLFDFNLFLPHYGKVQEPVAGPADLNENGQVDLFDFNLFLQNYGLTSP